MLGRQAKEHDETYQRNERRRREVVVRRATAGVAVANAAMEGRDDLEDHPRAGQLLQWAMEHGAERTGGNTNAETWEQICTALQMAPQRSAFQFDQAGTDAAVHRPLLRR